MTDLASRVAQRHLETLRTAASAAEKDMELAWAYADAWPDKTLFEPQLRFKIYQKVKQYATEMQTSVAIATQKGLKTVWKDGVAYEVRNLNYRSRKWISPELYVELMTAICPRYNGFSIKKVAAGLLHPEARKAPLYRDLEVQAAREGSPCLYMKGDAEILDWFNTVAGHDIMRADEVSLKGNVLRLWWD